MRPPRISVIVPAHNEEEVILECLDALVKETYPHKEIVVVNDGSTDETRKIVEGYGNSIRLLNFTAGHSAAFSRNAGAGAAQGDILVFVDADQVVGRDFLTRIADDFANYKVDAMGVNVQRKNDGSLISKCYFEEYGRWDKLKSERYRTHVYNSADVYSTWHVYDLASNAFIFTRELFAKLNGYDERIFYFEDGDITHRALRMGARILFDPEIVLYHRDPWTLREVFRQGLYLGKARMRLLGLGGEYRKAKWAWGESPIFLILAKPFFYPVAILTILMSPLVWPLPIAFIAVLLFRTGSRIWRSRNAILSVVHELVVVPVHRIGMCMATVREFNRVAPP